MFSTIQAMQHDEAGSVSAAPAPFLPPSLTPLLATPLARRIAQSITEADGWLPFDRFMAMALYEPGLGYYARDSRQFGLMPSSGSDFVTAPEMSPLFGRALARQVVQALDACDGDEVWEFGAGSGVLALHLLDELASLGRPLRRYTIVDLSGSLRARQRERLAGHADTVCWVDALPQQINGVVIGNEVLDAMPVQLLHAAVPADGQAEGLSWSERGVAIHQGRFCWADRPTALRPPVEQASSLGTVTEIHPQAEAFIRSLADRMHKACAFFIDYGFPEAEYYHPQRSGGTLVCHRAHRVDADPLDDVGEKDITAHVNFSGIALAAQEAGLEVIGYTSQARFLLNCGIASMLESADLRERAHGQKLVNEHEMGELFKVIAFAKGCDPAFAASALGFMVGDRSHSL